MAATTFSWMRLRGFIRKEFLQIKRDPSSLLLGIVMPVLLLLIFGYGVSLDPKDVPVALVIEDNSAEAREIAARFELSPYFVPHVALSMKEAVTLLEKGAVDGVVRIQNNFSSKIAFGQKAPIQVILNGIDANRARILEGYIQAAVIQWFNIRAARDGTRGHFPLQVESRIWFNSSPVSSYSLIPGLLTLIMTLIGTLLTALVIAREWERGTMESLLSTPIRSDEILVGKVVPYFVLGVFGMALAVVLGLVLFHVPLRGSVIVLFGLSSIFLLASLGLGLFISAVTRVQFVAAMASVISGFLPAFFLSGLLFDLQSTPQLIQILSYIIPAKYFVIIAQTIFLAGNVWSALLPAAATLFGMAVVLFIAARRKLVRRLPTS